DLGRGRRPDPGGRLAPRHRPGAAVVAGRGGRRSPARAVAGLRGAALRRVPRVLRLRPAGALRRRVRGAAERQRGLRDAGHARRGAVRARRVRRAAQSAAPDRAVTGRRAILLGAAALAAGLAGLRLWLAFGGSVPAPPPFAELRAAHRPSDLLVLDRAGEVIQEV